MALISRAVTGLNLSVFQIQHLHAAARLIPTQPANGVHSPAFRYDHFGIHAVSDQRMHDTPRASLLNVLWPIVDTQASLNSVSQLLHPGSQLRRFSLGRNRGVWITMRWIGRARSGLIDLVRQGSGFHGRELSPR